MSRVYIFSIFFVIILFDSMQANTQTNPLPQCKNAFIVIAHRGNHIRTPENTLSAYQDAIDVGADFLEIDLRMTRDSQLVIMHNATIDNMTDGKGKISDFLLDSLREIKIRDKNHLEWGFHKIPTFKEVLKLCKGRINIYLDFKNASVKLAYKEISEASMTKNIIVYINSIEQYSQWRSIAPQIPLMASIPQNIKTRYDMEKFLDLFKIDILDGNYNDYNKEMVQYAKERQIPIWADIQSSNENVTQWEKAISIGLDGLQTDDPEALINYLKLKRIR